MISTLIRQSVGSLSQISRMNYKAGGLGIARNFAKKE
jgi:hypothetical protein